MTLMMVMDMKMMNKYSSISYSLVSYSFGVVLGVASPLQLLVMTVGTNNDKIITSSLSLRSYWSSMKVLEITIFVINEVIGRDYIGAVDAGDTIFVHIFGAYFGLTVARCWGASFGVFDPVWLSPNTLCPCTASTLLTTGCSPERTSPRATLREPPPPAIFSPWSVYKDDYFDDDELKKWSL